MKKTILIGYYFYSAVAYGGHQNWSKASSNLQQFTTQSEVLESSFLEQEENIKYKGYGLKSSIAYSSPIRLSAYHLYRDTSKSLSNSIRGSELGVDAKLPLYGSALNVVVGLGFNGCRLIKQTPDESLVYFGQGYSGSLGFERFVRDRVSVTLSIKDQAESLRSTEREASLSTLGLAFAISLWLNK